MNHDLILIVQEIRSLSMPTKSKMCLIFNPWKCKDITCAGCLFNLAPIGSSHSDKFLFIYKQGKLL